MVETSVEDDPEKPNMYTRVLEAVRAWQDNDMLTRLTEVRKGDLVAIDAHYHWNKSYYIKYVGRDVGATKKRTQQFKVHGTSVRQLITELTPTIIENNEVFFLRTLRKRFIYRDPGWCWCTQPRGVHIPAFETTAAQRVARRSVHSLAGKD